MTLSPHRVSAAAFSALAAGGGGGAAVTELRAAQVSKNRVLLRWLLDESRRAGHPDVELVTQAYETLAALEDEHQAAVSRCLAYPAVGAWLLSTCRTLPAGEPGRLAAVALTAAIRVGTARRLRVRLHRGTLMLPSLGRLTLPGCGSEPVEVDVRPVPGGAVLRVDDVSVRVGLLRDSPGWRVLHRITGVQGLRLTIDDLDPWRWPGHGAGDRLPEARRRTWVACARRAWRILLDRHVSVAEEVAAAVSVLTPLTSRPGMQHSACSRDAFGTIALTDPADGLGMAVTLAHELQHAKLNALNELVELVRPDDGRRYYAPWRPDPRPLFGLLHGTYAHAGIAGFWRRHLEDDSIGDRAHLEFARWCHAAYETTGTMLDSGGLTTAGTDLVTALRETLRAWRAEPVAPSAVVRARLQSRRHRQEWERINS